MRDPDLLQHPSGTPLGIERRRPGRPKHASPELVPLLRGKYCSVPPVEPLPAEDDLAAAKGIALGLLLSLSLWAALGLWVWGPFPL